MVIDRRDDGLVESFPWPFPGCSPGDNGSGTDNPGGVVCNGIDSNGIESSATSSLLPVTIMGAEAGIVGLEA